MSTEPGRRPPTAHVVNASIVLLCLIWGSTWIVIRGGLEDLPPYTSAAWRFLVAGVAMIAVVRLGARREGGEKPPAWLWMVLGSLNFAASYGIVYRTETILPSGLVSLLWGVFPMLQALGSHLYLPGERVRGVQWAGFVLGFAGLAILYATDLQDLGPQAVPAALVLFLSPLVSAVGNTLVKRHGAGASSLVLNRNGMLFGAGLLALAAFLLERSVETHWTAAAVGSVAYLSIAGTVVTFGLYFWLLRWVDAHKLSLIAYVTPAIALTLGSLVGDEPFTSTMLAGAACILAGVLLVVRQPSARH